MEKLIFVKLCKHIDLAHLYEHIWAAKLTQALRSRGLYEYLDYFFEANTYNTGFIYVELYINKEQEDVIRNAVDMLEIDDSEKTIHTAMGQIMSEEQLASSGDIPTIMQDLRKLHDELWVENSDLDVFDYRSMRRTAGSFLLVDKKVNTRKIICNITIPESFTKNEDQRKLLPVFYALAYTLNYIVRDVISNTYGYYSFADTFGVSAKGAKLTNSYRAELAEFPKLTTESEQIRKTLKYELASELIPHIANVLRRPDYSTMTYRIDESIIYKHTGVLMGGRGWQKHATLENLILLLKNTSVEFLAGRDDRQIIRIAELIRAM